MTPERDSKRSGKSGLSKIESEFYVYSLLISALPKRIKTDELNTQRFVRSPAPAEVSHSTGDVSVDTGGVCFVI